MIAKKINTIPSLNPEDKPDTPNYSDYVTKVMLINSNLVPALTSLAKENRNAATDLADRIERKEVRVIANYILLADSINISKETKKGKESARLHQ
ncbi:MAG TPA: hypothetical protein PKD26_03305 [Pyrinomonadaceae bacterium]|nr:hypothetical protein [Pyrinomonadaceae bacterium]